MRTEIKTRDEGTLSFWAPDRGGHVYIESEDRPCQLGQQVCDGLAQFGNTLRWTPADGDFSAFIRAERSKGLRKLRREMSKW